MGRPVRPRMSIQARRRARLRLKDPGLRRRRISNPGSRGPDCAGAANAAHAALHHGHRYDQDYDRLAARRRAPELSQPLPRRPSLRPREPLPARLAPAVEVAADAGHDRDRPRAPGAAAARRRSHGRSPHVPRGNPTRTETCRAPAPDRRTPIAFRAERASRVPYGYCRRANTHSRAGSKPRRADRLRSAPLWSRAGWPRSPIPCSSLPSPPRDCSREVTGGPTRTEGGTVESGSV